MRSVFKLNLKKAELTPVEKRQINKHRSQIKAILSGDDTRILVVVGPCSAWSFDATLEFAKRLSAIQSQFEDKIKFVMRVYTQKPRTSTGWKGVLYQPDPCKNVSLTKGVAYVQKLMKEITALDLAIADEALFLPETLYFEDYLSYVAIGARSSEDQMHRNFAGTRNYAVGIKNPTSGDLEVLANSILAAQNEAVFYSETLFYKSSGNKYAHSILRGGKKPNYNLNSFRQAVQLQTSKGIIPKIMIDTNHANSGKEPLKQPKIANTVLNYLSKHPELKQYFVGFMIEAFLQDGNQKIDCKNGLKKDGLSITDPVLGWEKTLNMLNTIYSKI